MLRYITSTLTACALVGTVSVLAQEPAPAQPEKQQAPKETLTGCVVEAKTTDGGKAYVLNNVKGGLAAMYVLVGSSQSARGADRFDLVDSRLSTRLWILYRSGSVPVRGRGLGAASAPGGALNGSAGMRS